jgi:hypothetical protein
MCSLPEESYSAVIATHFRSFTWDLKLKNTRCKLFKVAVFLQQAARVAGRPVRRIRPQPPARHLIALSSPFHSFISFQSYQCEQRAISTMSGSINPVDEEMSVLSMRSSERIPSPIDQTKTSHDAERGNWEFLQRHVQMMAIGGFLL